MLKVFVICFRNFAVSKLRQEPGGPGHGSVGVVGRRWNRAADDQLGHKVDVDVRRLRRRRHRQSHLHCARLK